MPEAKATDAVPEAKVVEAPEAARDEDEGSLLSEIVRTTQARPSEEGYDLTRRGVIEVVIALLGSKEPGQRADKALIDTMIAKIDQKLGAQVDEILHHPEFQKVESTWRGLKFLVDHTNFRENIKIEILNASKEELLDNFDDAGEVVRSGLYKHAYTAEYGTFGGTPIGAIIGNYEFGPGPQDMKLLQQIASVAAMAHAPFIAAAGPKFFDLEDFRGLPNLKDLKSVFEQPKYAKWRSFRETEDARYVGLTVPQFLLRLPYGEESNPIRAFNYEENVKGNHDAFLWGNTALALATRLTDSFAKFRWCPNIIGPQSGGAVEDLPLYQFEAMGDIETKIPTEVLIPGRQDYELSEEGFIALVMRKGSDNAAFFSANSVQKPKYFGISKEGKESETNYKLGTQLPYMFVICRLVHYIKVLQTEQIGSWKERADLERELNKWIKQYVAAQENPPPEIRSRRPLRDAQIVVEDVEGDPGWYRVSLSVRPHFKYMGANFTLSLVGRLDKK